jgi:hypothetical protein
MLWLRGLSLGSLGALASLGIKGIVPLLCGYGTGDEINQPILKAATLPSHLFVLAFLKSHKLLPTKIYRYPALIFI